MLLTCPLLYNVQRHLSTVQKIHKTIEVPQLQVVEQIVEVPEIQVIQGTQTSENLGTALVRRVAQAEVVEAIEIGALPPAESAPRLGSSSSCC